MNWINVSALGLLAALPLVGLDRDFRAIGDGMDAPSELTVYRRANGYVILVGTEGKPAFVSAVQSGKPVFRLNAENGSLSLPDGKKAEAKPISQCKTLSGWFIPDALSGVNGNDLLDLTAAYEGGQAVLPDAAGFPLRVSGRKGREYNWNDEETTILEQVSNTRLDFSDFEYDISDAGVADLLSGSAEVAEGTLRLKALLREPANCTMRVFLDTVPEAGYKGDGADFLLENASLNRFVGEDSKAWKWEQVARISFQQEGTAYAWELPLSLIRPATAGRFRIRFQARNDAGTDEMPSYGKILPILRPGNLAAEPTTIITVSSCSPMYKVYPLTDGQTSRRIHWCFESWATANAVPQKCLEFTFPAPTPIRQMLVWWEQLPKAAEVQILSPEGQWISIITQKGDSDANASEWVQSEIGAALVEPGREKLKQAQKNIFPFPEGTVTTAIRIADPKELWIREIEIY